MELQAKQLETEELALRWRVLLVLFETADGWIGTGKFERGAAKETANFRYLNEEGLMRS